MVNSALAERVSPTAAAPVPLSDRGLQLRSAVPGREAKRIEQVAHDWPTRLRIAATPSRCSRMTLVHPRLDTTHSLCRAEH
jgi:hypothetical protein